LNSKEKDPRKRRKEKASMFKVQSVPFLALPLVGSLDLLTTVIGIMYFGAVEANPFMAKIASISLLAFAIVKLAATFSVGLLFYGADKILLTGGDSLNRKFKLTQTVLRVSCIVLTGLLLAAVVNNVLVWIKIM
jgi:hypothetical protein